jgi:hypothetical protein
MLGYPFKFNFANFSPIFSSDNVRGNYYRPTSYPEKSPFIMVALS